MSSSEIEPPRILFFEERRWGTRLRAWFAINVITAVYRVKFWRLQSSIRKTSALDSGDLARYKLGRRFALGATAGFLAARYSFSPNDGSLRDYLMYADVFSHWSSFLVTADAAMDSKVSPVEASTELLRKCFHALFGAPLATYPLLDTPRIRRLYFENFRQTLLPQSIAPYPRTSEYKFENYAIEMASIVGNRLCTLAHRHRNSGLQSEFLSCLQDFYERTLSLIAGQLSSLDQMIVDHDHDWGWYRNVLNSKSMNVILALLGLFVSQTPERKPSEKMTTCFYLINQSFFHRQVLDDLLDVEEDICNGAANSLVYMIVSQGRVAACCTGEDSLSIRRKIALEIGRSQLLASEFTPVTPFGLMHAEALEGIDHGGTVVETLIREALTNRAVDRDKPLEELINSCSIRRALLEEAWSQRNWGKVIAVVKESGIAARILASIARRDERTKLESELRSLDDDDVREVMGLFYFRTLRTYQKCLAACESYI